MCRFTLPRTHTECGGCRTWFTDVGEGPAILLVPSMLVRVESYEPTIARLGRRRRVISVQPPGSGRAQRVRTPWSFERYAEWIVRFIRQVGLDRPALLGHSNSAAAVALAAAQYPGCCSSLVLVDAAGFDASRSLPRVIAGRAVDAVIEWRLSLARWHHLAANAMWHTRSAWRQATLSADVDLRPVLPRIAVPTLLAWGGRDHTMPQRIADAMRARLRQPEAVVNPQGSHDWLITHAREFAEAADRFLSAIDCKSCAGRA